MVQASCAHPLVLRLADGYDAFLLDLDGVVWRGEQEIEGAGRTIESLRAMGKRVVFVTNNASRTPRSYAGKLMRMRVPTAPADVVTSAHAVVSHLRADGVGSGSRIHICGTSGFAEVIKGGGFVPTDETHDIEAVVVGWNPDFAYRHLAAASDLARSGVRLVAANRDLTFPTADGLLPGAGAILAAVEAASGARAVVVGKPEPALFLAALERAGVARERALMVGDRLDTDIEGARAAGIDSALVLTGVTQASDLDGASMRADHVLADLRAILDPPKRRAEPGVASGEG